jgi:oligopeptide transport system ATP-binding protein
MKSYPHKMSGGQRQRVMIAMANDPDILIADADDGARRDHPGADPDAAGRTAAQARHGVVFITHDLGYVSPSRFADRVHSRYGEVVEEGEAGSDLRQAAACLHKMLLAAEPTGSKAPPPANAPVTARSRTSK